MPHVTVCLGKSSADPRPSWVLRARQERRFVCFRAWVVPAPVTEACTRARSTRRKAPPPALRGPQRTAAAPRSCRSASVGGPTPASAVSEPTRPASSAALRCDGGALTARRADGREAGADRDGARNGVGAAWGIGPARQTAASECNIRAETGHGRRHGVAVPVLAGALQAATFGARACARLTDADLVASSGWTSWWHVGQ